MIPLTRVPLASGSFQVGSRWPSQEGTREGAGGAGERGGGYFEQGALPVRGSIFTQTQAPTQKFGSLLQHPLLDSHTHIQNHSSPQQLAMTLP